MADHEGIACRSDGTRVLATPAEKQPSMIPSPAPPPPAAEAVLRFLESAGKRGEAEFYLQLFRNLPKESFAITLPGAAVVRQGLAGFVEQLRFLSELGLTTPVVLGLLDPATSAASADRLLQRLEQVGVTAARYDAASVDANSLAAHLKSGTTPVVVLSAPDPAARLSWLARVAADLGTRKLVLVRWRGGFVLRGERRVAHATKWRLALDGNTLSLVNLKTDAELLHGTLLGKTDRHLLSLAQELMAEASGLTINVTSPMDLLRELFTVRGAGTLIKPGSDIQRHDSFEGLDEDRLAQIFEQSFDRRLDRSFFRSSPQAVYVEQDYRGAAVVCASPNGPYLSKFAVVPAARGDGLGRDLWTQLTRDFERLFWRTRADNPARSWYLPVCDAMVRRDPWYIFLRGLSPDEIPTAVSYVESLNDDFRR